MAQNVKFISVKLKSSFTSLETKDPFTLYWIAETSELFKGDQLFGTGALATDKAAGLLSSEDYVKLQNLIASNGGLEKLTAVDGTMKIVDTADDGKAIGVVVAPDVGNVLQVVEGGLFVPTVIVPEYSIEKQATAEDGFATTYKLKKVTGEEVSYVGDSINIAKDLVLKSATLETASEEGVPYDEAKVGDPYIKMEFNDAAASSLYIPVKGLVDTYTAGDGISIDNGVVSVKIAENTHGLVAVDGALDISLATRKSDGAMSAQDKKIVDSIPYAYVARKYDISGVPNGTLVDYGEKEIRVMVPDNAEFVKQSVGAGGDANTYYMTIRTYAPSNAAGYKEHLGEQVDNKILTDLKTDEYGRNYQPTWLGVAKFDETTGVWNYYGSQSSVDKYIGWDYQIDWFDIDNVMIASDSVRVNLSNENCHNNTKPYYMANYATSSAIDELKESIDEIQQNSSWEEW